MGLTKQILLNHLARVGEADAQDVARTFEVSYSVAAMGLLRLVRQGLASRHRQAANQLILTRVGASTSSVSSR